MCFYCFPLFRDVLPIAGQSLPLITYCQLNISSCAVSERSNQFIVNVYNSLTRNIDKYVRVPVLAGSYLVLDPQGEFVSN